MGNKAPQSIYNLGHRAIRDLFTVPVQIQEKVDGSFFAFGVFEACSKCNGQTENGKCGVCCTVSHLDLRVRSKRANMVTDAPEALFKLATKAAKDREHMLHPGWQYRGETLAKKQHNALSYDRTPKDNIILFDVLTDDEAYLPYEELCVEAARLDLEVVPQLFAGTVKDVAELRQFLDTTSILGGQKVEGIVIKPLTPMYGPDKKMLFGKFVSEAFREVHRKAWGESNPGSKDVIQQMIAAYGNPGRFAKALIHLREDGVIEDSLRDIAALMREVPIDIRKECEDHIKNALFKQAWPHIARGIVKQIPEWYKEHLLRLQFEKEEQNADPELI